MATPAPSVAPSPPLVFAGGVVPGTSGAPEPPKTPLPPEWQDFFNFFSNQFNSPSPDATSTAGGTSPDGTPTPPGTQPTFQIDPNLLKQILAGSAASKPVDPELTQAQSAYLQIWGVQAPKGYLEALIKQGMNVYEIVQHELSKPAAQHSSYWRDSEAHIAQVISTAFGMR